MMIDTSPWSSCSRRSPWPVIQSVLQGRVYHRFGILCAGNAKDSLMDLDNDYYHHHLRLHVESGFVRMTAATHLSGTKTKHITVGVVIFLIIFVHYLKYIILSGIKTYHITVGVLIKKKTFHCHCQCFFTPD